MTWSFALTAPGTQGSPGSVTFGNAIVRLRPIKRLEATPYVATQQLTLGSRGPTWQAASPGWQERAVGNSNSGKRLVVHLGVGVGGLQLIAGCQHRQAAHHAIHIEAVRRTHPRAPGALRFSSTPRSACMR